MAAKLKPIKTQNEYNILTGDALGDKVAVVVFYDGGDAATWKKHTEELNDIAGDFYEVWVPGITDGMMRLILFADGVVYRRRFSLLSGHFGKISRGWGWQGSHLAREKGFLGSC